MPASVSLLPFTPPSLSCHRDVEHYSRQSSIDANREIELP